jgi:hypothetical protein
MLWGLKGQLIMRALSLPLLGSQGLLLMVRQQGAIPHLRPGGVSAWTGIL